MSRGRREPQDRPLPPRRESLPAAWFDSDPYTCREPLDTRRTIQPEDLYREVVEDAEWSIEFVRPKRVAECPPGPYCPFVGCQFHLYLDVNPETGNITYNHPGLNVWELEECCVLKALEKKLGTHEDGYTLEEVGRFMGLTRERVRQIEEEWIDRVRTRAASGSLGEGYRDLYYERADGDE